MLALALRLYGGLPHALSELSTLSPERVATPWPTEVAQHLSTFVLMHAFPLFPHQATRTFAARSASMSSRLTPS